VDRTGTLYQFSCRYPSDADLSVCQVFFDALSFQPLRFPFRTRMTLEEKKYTAGQIDARWTPAIKTITGRG
jgi:hypothetical protein